MTTFYVYPDYEIHEEPAPWKSDDYLIIEAETEEDALDAYLDREGKV